MSAVILPLPGAAAAPVQTPKLPPGRPPKGVTSIAPGSAVRAYRRNRMNRAAALAARAQGLRNCAEGSRDYEAWALGRAAELDAEARALREPAR